jgi:hypothetical protein
MKPPAYRAAGTSICRSTMRCWSKACRRRDFWICGTAPSTRTAADRSGCIRISRRGCGRGSAARHIVTETEQVAARTLVERCTGRGLPPDRSTRRALAHRALAHRALDRDTGCAGPWSIHRMRSGLTVAAWSIGPIRPRGAVHRTTAKFFLPSHDSVIEFAVAGDNASLRLVQGW